MLRRILPPFGTAGHSGSGLNRLNHACTLVAGARRVRGLLFALGVLLGCVPLFSACSHSATGPTAPQGLDPTVLIMNQTSGAPDSLVFRWYDQTGQTAVFVVQPGQQLCTHFFATPLPDSAAVDSVRFHIFVGDTTGLWSASDSPWFDPRNGHEFGTDSTAEYWTVLAGGSGTTGLPLDAKTVPTAPC